MAVPAFWVRSGGHTTLLEWLRSTGYTGCKEGCAEGECGACAVLVARPEGTNGSSGSRWTAINACLVPAAGFDAQEVITSEGLGEPDALHPVQQQMADRGGSQCGYCTPGFICSMAAEYYRADRTAVAGSPTHNGDTRPASRPGRGLSRGMSGTSTARTVSTCMRLSGNLCRCTGYRPIQDAAYALGTPEESDPLGPALRRAGTGARAHRDHRGRHRLPAAGRPGAGGGAAGRAPGRGAGRRVHRLGGGAEHPARPQPS